MINNILSNLTSNDNSKNVEQIGDNIYEFNVFLNNGVTKMGIKFSAIDELNIVDDLRYFYVYGTLTINYNNDVLEAMESTGSLNTGQKGYSFRGDGRDLLEIEIMPQLKEQKCLQVYASESEKRKYCIKHTCSIYKYEDLTKGKGVKQRKLYFWDRDYQILSEVNIDYSTCDKNKNKKQYVEENGKKVEVAKSNTDCSITTSEALDDILKKALSETAKLKYTKGSWDKGETKLIYNSISNNRAIDDVRYVLEYHVSDTKNFNMPCLLKKERYTGKYNLIPINQYYKGGSGTSLVSFFGGSGGMGSEVIEDFFIGKIDSTTSGVTRTNKNLFNFSNNKTNLSDYNLIEDYKFVRIDARDLQKYLTTTVVHTNDPRGFFNSDIKQNNVKSIEKTYNEVFVKGGTTSGKSSSSGLPTNKLRTDYKNVRHEFVPYSLNEKQRRNFGINKNMLNLFFKNTSITFKARGNTIRQTGKFFTINRTDSNISNSHDNNLLGKYLITYIRHEFKSGSYNNTIHGVKPYTAEKQGFSELI